MKKPSTHSLEDLPSVADLIRLSKALAMLDAIVSQTGNTDITRSTADRRKER